MTKQRISIKMFQSFSLTYQRIQINEDTIKSTQLLKLFAYLLINYKRNIPFHELIELLWYGESSDNPDHALKNLVYRLRRLINKELQVSNLILTEKGFYAINTKDYKIVLDIELFESSCKRLDDSSDMKKYHSCLKHYQGKLLPSLADEISFLENQGYYHSLYVETVIKYSELLERQNEYQKLKALGQQALMIDRYEEEFHYIYIKAYYLLGGYKKAMELYNHTENFFYRSLGVELSSKLQDLYQLIREQNYHKNVGLLDIQEDIYSKSQHSGAYLCEYDTFQNLYLMQAKIIDRLGISVQIALITLDTDTKDKSTRESETQYIEKIMQMIQSSLVKGLRSADAITRISVNQFAILLPICNFEDASYAIQRVLKKVNNKIKKSALTLKSDIQEVQSDRAGKMFE